MTRWAAYLTTLNAGPANVEPLQQAATVLRDLSRAESLTFEAVAMALRQAGMTWIQCPEGVLALDVALTFDDVIAGPVKLEREPELRAVLRGVSSGILWALALRDGDGTIAEQRLEQEAFRQRAAAASGCMEEPAGLFRVHSRAVRDNASESCNRHLRPAARSSYHE